MVKLLAKLKGVEYSDEDAVYIWQHLSYFERVSTKMVYEYKTGSLS